MKMPWGKQAGVSAVIGEHHNILEYLYKSKYPHFTAEMCAQAAKQDDVPALKYLRDVCKAPWDEETGNLAACSRGTGNTRRNMTHSTISCSPSFHILRPTRASTRAKLITSSVSNTCSKPSKCPFTATALEKRDTLGIRATVTTISKEKAIESLRCESIDFLVKFA